jgi:hypothetical protein
MKLQMQTVLVPLLTAAVLGSGCASSDSRYGMTDCQYVSGTTNEGNYAVIASIASGPPADGKVPIGPGNGVGEVVGRPVVLPADWCRSRDTGNVAGAPVGGPLDHEAGKPDGQQNVYFIRLRFDDRSFQTVMQAGLDGLRVGDSVRIERGRVRRY